MSADVAMASATCQAAGCTKSATQQCPTCLKQALKPAYFCSQDCFKAAWAEHKKLHKPAEPKTVPVPDAFTGFNFSGPLRPFPRSPWRAVPDSIKKPDYAVTGMPAGEMKMRGNNTIPLLTDEEMADFRVCCKLAREVLDIAGNAVDIGVTADEIDRIVHEACIERDGYPSPLNYNGFPKSCCTSVNEIVCHGIPDMRPLADGDIVNVDVTLYFRGLHCDLNEMFLIGNVDEESRRLVQTTYECLEEAIKTVKPGTAYREPGNVIEKHAKAAGFSVIRTFCGHGLGKLFHCPPSIPHYAKNKAVGVMKPGHIFTIEPMINAGTYRDIMWPDNWTCATYDGKRSAQFEHTMMVTDTGVEVLTQRTRGSYIDRKF